MTLKNISLRPVLAWCCFWKPSVAGVGCDVDCRGLRCQARPSTARNNGLCWWRPPCRRCWPCRTSLATQDHPSVFGCRALIRCCLLTGCSVKLGNSALALGLAAWWWVGSTPKWQPLGRSGIRGHRHDGGLDVSNSMMQRMSACPGSTWLPAPWSACWPKPGDRIGLVVFAGESYVQCPLTTDVAAVKLFLQSVSPGMVATQGTLRLCHPDMLDRL